MDIKLTEAEKIKILNSDSLYKIMQRILLRENEIDRDREHMWVVGLAQNNKILFIELISLGSVNGTVAEPMEVYSFALQKRAVKIIMVHNHPSGELKPSTADKDLTDQMIQVGKIVKTPLLDHLIITEKSYLSFADEGLMDILSHSTKFVPPYKLKQELLEKRERLAKNEEFIESKAKIARFMFEKGETIESIIKIMGISKDEVLQLIKKSN